MIIVGEMYRYVGTAVALAEKERSPLVRVVGKVKGEPCAYIVERQDVSFIVNEANLVRV
jgi:hypothetical protein